MNDRSNPSIICNPNMLLSSKCNKEKLLVICFKWIFSASSSLPLPLFPSQSQPPGSQSPWIPKSANGQEKQLLAI